MPAWTTSVWVAKRLSLSRIFSRLDGPVGERSDVSARPLILLFVSASLLFARFARPHPRARFLAPQATWWPKRATGSAWETISFTLYLFFSLFLITDAAPSRIRVHVVSLLSSIHNKRQDQLLNSLNLSKIIQKLLKKHFSSINLIH